MMICKWCIEEVCTNADCPARADFCPCTGEYVEMCKYANDGSSKILIDSNVYDKCEIHHNCTVEIWENSTTGKISIGWYRESKEDD